MLRFLVRTNFFVVSMAFLAMPAFGLFLRPQNLGLWASAQFLFPIQVPKTTNVVSALDYMCWLILGQESVSNAISCRQGQGLTALKELPLGCFWRETSSKKA